MAFIASNGLTETGTSKTIEAGGMTVHYHDIGTGEPVLFLHSYGPGTTAWITFYKTIGVLSQHFRCILQCLYQSPPRRRLPSSSRRRLAVRSWAGASRARPSLVCGAAGGSTVRGDAGAGVA